MHSNHKNYDDCICGKIITISEDILYHFVVNYQFQNPDCQFSLPHISTDIYMML